MKSIREKVLEKEEKMMRGALAGSKKMIDEGYMEAWSIISDAVYSGKFSPEYGFQVLGEFSESQQRYLGKVN